MTDGTKANRTGNRLERFVEQALQEYGYVPFVNDKDRFPDGLIIECKWQQSPGSVDEKYPFLLFNIQKTGIPTIVLLDGDGYKPAAKRWLADQVRSDGLLRGVWNMGEFQKAINDGFLG